MTTLYHNPRCSKSREALHLLEAEGETLEIVKYLENPPSLQELKQVIELLGIEPMQLIRTQESIWKEKFKGKELTEEEVIIAMVENPKLIERPIAINGTRAVIGRPPEKVLDIL